ncbi:MAG: type site-specific deoxyribonuclease, HsdR family [Labilithrix sp.]|nr:type site-specific deoxyribonuclease, HsdR family [Labilithrix sp.]
MTKGKLWNELSLSEDAAIAVLAEHLGYTYVSPEGLEPERESLKQTVLVGRLTSALARLNPWLSEGSVQKAVRAVTQVEAAGLLDASEKVYTALTYGISLEQDGGTAPGGKKGRTVRFFDFDDPENNDLLVTKQFRLQGAKKQIVPDLVVFVNGIPLAVIECKSPTLGEKWQGEAIEQLLRYQEIGESYRELGMPRLFETVQIMIATCGQSAVYGTVTTPPRFFAEWKSPHPKTEAILAKELGRPPTPQDVLLYGVLAPANLLDVMKNFTAFERDEKSGKTVRKIPRYQQFAAVNKAIDRARTATRLKDRGGVVWHTQGSGKSLTMLWLAIKLRREAALDNPTLVIVTDRVDLDDQITKTFRACGFPNPDRAGSVKELRELLAGPAGKTVLTTVHKFQEGAQKSGTRDEYPTLSESKNIFVLSDEAHRSQYGSLAANMRKALPNAAFFGFTGTPIDKKDRSTLETFGPYIDTYTIEQAVADGATVPIFYEGRLPELRIIGASLDAVFDRVFADRSKEERGAIKKKYAREDAIAGAPKRIEAVCLDLLEHYTTFIQPNGFKAQIVAATREAAVLYKETLDRLNGPESAVLFSGSNDDEAHLVKHHTDKVERKRLVDRFLKPSQSLSILVVCDMLLTGFDAPIEQVMYLDSPLKEHTLLQAIARVNRVYDETKTYGLIVDYWGVSEALEEALAIFSPSDVAGAMKPKDDELPRLETRHQTAMRFFARVKKKDDLDECVAVLGAEDVRSEFGTAFLRLSQSLDMVFPDPKALPFVGDYKWLGKIRQAASARYRDPALDISDCGPKVRQLIEDAIAVEGIQILVKQVNLFTPEFEEKLEALKSDEAKASEMEHAIKDEIHVRLDENPVFFQSLRERLEQIIEDRKARRIDAAKQMELYATLVTDLAGQADVAKKLGLTEAAFAIYGLLQPGAPLPLAESTGTAYVKADPAKVALASVLEEALAPQTAIVDWQRKEEVQKEMRKRIKRQLRAAHFEEGSLDPTAESIVDLLKRRRS